MQNTSRVPMTTGPCSAKKLSQRTIVNTVYSVCSNVFMPTNLDAIPIESIRLEFKFRTWGTCSSPFSLSGVTINRTNRNQEPRIFHGQLD